MRTETKTYKIYSFSELSEEAKESVINKWREQSWDYTPFYVEEANESFEKFAEIFNITWYQIDYIEPYRNQYQIKIDSDILSLSGQRLATYIWNNYRSDLFKGKYYGRLSEYDKDGNKIVVSKEHPAGQRHVRRYSKCQFTTDCVMTGCYYDNEVLAPIYRHMDYFKNFKYDFKTLLDDCIYSLCHAVQQEDEYQNSEEAIIETIEANEYEFTEDGEIY